MAERVYGMDWSKTVLGPMDGWPQSLKIAVGICLNSRFPMFVWWGPELINIYNDAYVPMLGKRHPAALGRPARASWDDIWDVVGPQAEAVMSRGEATWNERVLLVMERNGYTEETWFTWSYSPIPDGHGRIGGLYCAVQEDTPRVLAERERDRLAGQRQLALDAARMGWWHYDPGTDVATYDRRYGEIFDVAGSERPNRDLLGRIHPEDVDRVWAAARVAMEPGSSARFSAEYRVVRGDGQVRWVEALGLATFQGDGDARRATSLVGTIVDVTDRRRAEELPRTILESITDAFFALDREWRFTYLNQQAERTLGRAPGEVVGEVIWDAYPGLVGSEFERAYRAAAEGGVSGSVTSYYPDHDRWYEVHAYPAPEGISVYFRDVSDRKRADVERERLLASERAARAEAERASEAKSQFLATLSHELRTPLTPVLLTASLMESHPGLPAALRADVAMIRRNVELESRLISDLLDLTRITNGKLQLDEQDVDLHLVVRSAIDICQREASARLTVDLRASRHTVRGDSTRLQQIFWNLINNAMKFTPPAGLVTVRSVDAPGGRVRVEVSDTGAGIDPAVLPRLFSAFEQGDVRASRQQAGLGLGLAISKKLTEIHGGTIAAASKGRGCGATFTVELPLLGHVGPAPKAAAPLAAAVVDAARSIGVLLVEDHEPTLNVMTRLLRSMGHRVTGASSVAAALGAVGRGGFDLIISDLGLPDGTGLDLMRQLREQYAGRAIALTGYGMEADITASREAGFAEHLIKPVDVVALQAAIVRVAASRG